MALINKPPNGAVDTQGGKQAPGWAPFFSSIFSLLTGLTASGTTAERPVPVWPGQPYFDISLGLNGKPIWANKGCTGWVDATGANV